MYAVDAEVYCDLYFLFHADTGLPADRGICVDRTDKRRVVFARQEAGCKPDDLEVHDTYNVKVLAVAS